MSTKTLLTASQKLTSLRSFIHKNSWVKGYSLTLLPNGKYAYCLVGAVYEASYRRDMVNINAGIEFKCISEAIRELFPERIGYYKANLMDLVMFNDHPDTTKADVRAVLTRAIEIAVEQEK